MCLDPVTFCLDPMSFSTNPLKIQPNLSLLCSNPVKIYHHHHSIGSTKLADHLLEPDPTRPTVVASHQFFHSIWAGQVAGWSQTRSTWPVGSPTQNTLNNCLHKTLFLKSFIIKSLLFYRKMSKEHDGDNGMPRKQKYNKIITSLHSKHFLSYLFKC